MLARPVISTNLRPLNMQMPPYTHRGGNIGAYDYYMLSILKIAPSLQETQTLPSSHLSVYSFNDSNLCCDVLLGAEGFMDLTVLLI